MDVLGRTVYSLLCTAVLLSACKPELSQGGALVTHARILAVRAEPAEVVPGATVSLTVLYADGSGTLRSGPIDWAFCTDRKPLAELGPVSSRCLRSQADWLVSLGSGLAASGSLPPDACRLFGPNPPEPRPGEPPGRPADPDPTGGYYQPVRLLTSNADQQEYTLFDIRLSCGVGSVTQAQAAEFNRRYHPNTSPAIASLSVVRESGSEEIRPEGTGSVTVVRASARLKLRVAWKACPNQGVCGDGTCGDDEDQTACVQDCAEPHGCSGSEWYIYFDRATRTQVRRREVLRASWFATGGTFLEERTGRAEEEAHVSESENVWIAPAMAGAINVWVVLRDDRGGVAWQGYPLRVDP